jgi:hypothetical protein
MSAEKELVLKLADEFAWGSVGDSTTRERLIERSWRFDKYIRHAQKLRRESPDNAPCSPFGVGASG